MSFNDNVPKLKPYSRSVSIIGVGATPFVRVLDDPAVDGLCEPELFGYAARDAMKDAGIDGSDVEFYIHGQAGRFRHLAEADDQIVAEMAGRGVFHVSLADQNTHFF